MIERVVTLQQLRDLADALTRSGKTIVGPVKRKERYFYEPVSQGADLALDFDYCVYSPRAVFTPPSERLLSYRFESGGKVKVDPDLAGKPVVLFGVHPCDCNALALFDEVFGAGVPDENYAARRRDSLVIGIDCHGPCHESVFCQDMKGNESRAGFDIMLVPLGGTGQAADRYGVKFATERGRELLVYNKVGAAASDKDGKDAGAFDAAKPKNFKARFPFNVEELPKILDKCYGSLLWQATAKRCYSCGSCNLSCPTCFCFNVTDVPDLAGAGGDRVREWDGCQLVEFANVSGGHNFRQDASSRLRHRIYRKAKWIQERHGKSGCVGCARCDRACTAKISALEMYTQLAEEV